MNRGPIRRAWLPLAALLTAACSVTPPLPAPSAKHPASPQAAEAALPAASTTLSMPERKPVGTTDSTPKGMKMRGH